MEIDEPVFASEIKLGIVIFENKKILNSGEDGENYYFEVVIYEKYPRK